MAAGTRVPSEELIEMICTCWWFGSAAIAARSRAGTLGSPTSLDRTVGTLARPVLFMARVRITSRV